METYQKIEAEINKVKEWNMEAGTKLHDQMHKAQNSQWSKEELAEYLKSDNDVADEYYEAGTPRHDEIRNIQDAIINFYGEEDE